MSRFLDLFITQLCDFQLRLWTSPNEEIGIGRLAIGKAVHYVALEGKYNVATISEIITTRNRKLFMVVMQESRATPGPLAL